MQPSAGNHEDEWEFSSSLPPDQPANLSVFNGDVKVDFSVRRTSDTELEIRSQISNQTAQPIQDLTFQLAVTKVRTIP